MMTTVVQENNHSPSAQNGSSKIPPSMLLIGKKRTLDYLAPALFRINNTGEVVIKATGTFSIVTAVDVAEMVKHDVENLATKSITVGTDELMVSTGERKRMSCIEIHLIKINPTAVATEPATKDISTQAPIVKKTITVVAEEQAAIAAAPVIVAQEEQTEEKKPKTRRKSTTTIQTAKKKRSTTSRKKKSED